MKHYALQSRYRQQGFTLIEIMVVVVIIAILAGIALPSYQGYTVGARRAAAAGCILEGAQFMERYYATNLRYTTTATGTALPTLPACGSAGDISTYYTIGFVGNAGTASSFTLQAVPTAKQNDGKCGTLSIDQKGTKAETGTAASASECF